MGESVNVSVGAWVLAGRGVSVSVRVSVWVRASVDVAVEEGDTVREAVGVLSRLRNEGPVVRVGALVAVGN